MFESILIANRGEIACRVLRSCRALGIRGVAVYSEADRDAPFVRMADQAFLLGPSEPEHSYLCGERILALARRAGATAIHPGYGFLAENPEFAEACAAQDIRFIGPPAAAIRAMGLKHAAKARMEAAGVRVLPGYRGEAQDPARLAEAARELGYPVLIKAVAGGGGKGMRRVDEPRAFARALEGAQREALSAFGDARVLIEKYLARARHIEVQIFADRYGNVVHLFERDCSLQRRHQKVLEEAPAPGCSPVFERSACELALRAARAISYEGAGTVEMIADVAEGLSEERLYFMEMNTRLQVEHAVTELVTGIDLVAWQIRVAAGEPLPCAQDQIARRGHAIEVRLCAEDPARDDLPQTGTLHHFALPETGPHLRIDAGVAQGDAVSIHYDSLLAKLIVWDVDRAAAVRRLRAALAGCEIAGVITNLSLLQAIAQHARFEAGELSTDFLTEQRAELIARAPEREEELWLLAVVGALESRRQRAAREPSPWADTRAFRLNEPHADVLAFAHGQERLAIPVRFGRDETLIDLPSRTVAVRAARLEGARLCCELRFPHSGAESRLGAPGWEGERLCGIYLALKNRSVVFARGHALEVIPFPSPLEVEDDAGASNLVKAPMPGKIHAVLVAEGERVARGQPLLSLEAMKMEHTLRAPVVGEVAALHAKVGEQVEEGRTLLVLRVS